MKESCFHDGLRCHLSPTHCCFDWCTCTADVISLPGNNQFTSSRTFNSQTHAHIVFTVISISTLNSHYLCDISLLVMCYFCSRPVTNVSLSILTDTGQCSRPAVIQTQSQVFWLPSACSSPSSSSSSSFSASTFPEPPAKKSKQHNAISTNDLNACRVAVTAVTKLTPLLNSGRVKCHVMLHYIQTPDAFSFMSNQRPVVLHCGQVALDIQNNLHTELLKTPQLIAGKSTKVCDL